MVTRAPFSVSVEQITTGVGRSLMILRRKVMPSMRGISTSSTITSGHCWRIFSMASNGSAAVAMTSMPGASLSTPTSTWRTTAESSTTIALMVWDCGMGRLNAVDTVDPWLRLYGRSTVPPG